MMKSINGADTNHPDIAECYTDIGHAYEGLGDNKLALECHIKSLEMMKAIYGADASHPDIAKAYTNIGKAHRSLGDHKLAKDCDRKASNITQSPSAMS